MKVQPKTQNYPLLLTAMEPDTTEWDYEEKDDLWLKSDVYQAEYRQADTLEQDQFILRKKAVAKRRGFDDCAVGWNAQGEPLALVYADKPLRRVLKSYPKSGPTRIEVETEASSAVVSASQRYYWTSHNEEKQKPSIREWDRESQSWKTIWHGDKEVQALSPDPTRDSLLFAVRDGFSGPVELLQYTPGSGCRNWPTPVPIQCTSMAMSPDGEHLAYVDTRDAQVKVCNLKTGEQLTVSDEDFEAEDDCYGTYLPGDHASPAWSPDGRRLFYTRSNIGMEEETIYVGQSLYVATPDGKERRCLASPFYDDRGVFSVCVGPRTTKAA